MLSKIMIVFHNSSMLKATIQILKPEIDKLFALMDFHKEVNVFKIVPRKDPSMKDLSTYERLFHI